MNHQPPSTEEEIRAERRRQRWNAFWTPFITLTAVVSSVAMLMGLIQTCQQRNLPAPLLPPTSPLHRSGATGSKPDQAHVGGGNIAPQPEPTGQSDKESPAR